MLYELTNLVKSFGSRIVLDLPHLALAAGKVYALVGPNGAGKTTLLNHLAFLEQPTSGAVEFRNSKVTYDRSGLTLLRRQVVLVDQSPILFSGNVWKNIEFGLKVRGMTKKQRFLKITEALERVGMASFAMFDVHGLSGGEVKRVALARALALDPDVLLCDEPTANVDREHQEIILKILEHANSVRNTSIIFATHYLSQSRRLAHQTILLQNGRLADNIAENTYKGVVFRDTADNVRFKLTEDVSLPLAATELPAEPADSIFIHIIPERIILLPYQDGGRKGTKISGTVKSITHENGNVRIVVDIGVLLHVLLDNRLYLSNPPLAGQQVGVVVPDGAAVVVN